METARKYRLTWMMGEVSRLINLQFQINLLLTQTKLLLTIIRLLAGIPPSPPSVDPNMIKPHGSSTLGAAKEPLPSTSNPQPPTEKNEKS